MRGRWEPRGKRVREGRGWGEGGDRDCSVGGNLVVYGSRADSEDSTGDSL